MLRIILILSISILPAVAFSQGILDGYIRQGLENNLALKQKQANYHKSLEALKEARSWFYPNVSLNARYSVADGGRIIEFPVGTMLNPVYSTLNILTSSNDFPLIDDMEFTFLRKTEHDTKLSVIQPVIDPKIHYGQKISKELSQAQYADAESYKRQLVADIKTAYFSYLKTLRLEQLLADTRILVEENVRVNESLYRNDKVTIDNVYRSNAELSRLDQQMAEARKSKQVAGAWFNFLLNRPLEQEILVDEEYGSPPVSIDLLAAQTMALNNREELDMLESYSNANDYLISLNQTRKLPSLIAAVDYGYQGTDYVFTDRYDYVLASLVLRWDLFHGFENRARISQARIERDIRQDQIRETRNQIRLQVIQAYYDLEAAQLSIQAADEELQSARKAFQVINKKYSEGQANLIEYIDARTTMTSAEQNLIISKYDYLIKYAELERVACLEKK